MDGTPIRPARLEDIPVLMAIRLAVAENRLADPSRVTPADCARFIAAEAVWVWEEAGEVAGFSAAQAEDGSIWALFVRPDSEGRGIGRALLARACDHLRRAGHRRLQLTTGPGTRAERLYRRLGWREAGRADDGDLVLVLGEVSG